jgi:toxin-antitoxin system PIN domain toxin
MIAVDTNILVYAHRLDSPWHQAARESVSGLAEGRGQWAIPWPSVHEFFAIVTHAKIFATPTPLAIALDQVEAWLESPKLVLLSETAGYWERLSTVVSNARVQGGQVHDARIAALCLHHGVQTLWSADRDFSRYRDLRVLNPLVS